MYLKRVLHVLKYTPSCLVYSMAKDSLLFEDLPFKLLLPSTEWTMDNKNRTKYGRNSTLQTQWQIETGQWQIINDVARSQDSQRMPGSQPEEELCLLIMWWSVIDTNSWSAKIEDGRWLTTAKTTKSARLCAFHKIDIKMTSCVVQFNFPSLPHVTFSHHYQSAGIIYNLRDR
jgi:hypothetical protein